APPPTYTLSLHDALPISLRGARGRHALHHHGAEQDEAVRGRAGVSGRGEAVVGSAVIASLVGWAKARLRRAHLCVRAREGGHARSEEHTSELQSPCNLVC